MTVEARYRQDGAAAILSCVLDDLVLLYHRPSGQTHMVISPVPEILEALEDGAALTVAQLHARLAARYELGGAAEALPAIAAHLTELAALGLVRIA